MTIKNKGQENCTTFLQGMKVREIANKL